VLRRNHPRASLLVWLHPVIMVAVVSTTGNHYVLDVAETAALLAVAIATVRAVDRHRRVTRAARAAA